MIVIKMSDKIGTFASNKDIAKEIRTTMIIPALERQESIVIDFEGVNGATQSFLHALMSEGMRRIGVNSFLDKVSFQSCNEKIQTIVTIVTDYMQAGLDDANE